MRATQAMVAPSRQPLPAAGGLAPAPERITPRDGVNIASPGRTTVNTAGCNCERYWLEISADPASKRRASSR